MVVYSASHWHAAVDRTVTVGPAVHSVGLGAVNIADRPSLYTHALVSMHTQLMMRVRKPWHGQEIVQGNIHNTAIDTADMTLTSRVQAVRLVCHLLAGGEPDKLPGDWMDPDYIGPPGPAAEFGHDKKAIASSVKSDDETGWPAQGCFIFHQHLCHAHKLGLVTASASDKKGRKQAQRVSDWSLQAMAGAPCMALMLDRIPAMLKGVVCSRHCTCE